jgi:hypothetical protein
VWQSRCPQELEVEQQEFASIDEQDNIDVVELRSDDEADACISMILLPF